jgi:hypothetical protein
MYKYLLCLFVPFVKGERSIDVLQVLVEEHQGSRSYSCKIVRMQEAGDVPQNVLIQETAGLARRAH